VTFHLNPKARFHNGKPVQAADVLHSYNTLIGPDCSPAYKTLLAGVKAAVVLDAQRIRFELAAPDRQLPLLLGGLPIFSRDWGRGKPFAQVVLDTPIGSGPYRIGNTVFGRDITYVRDKNYWGSGLNVRQGSYNFDRVSVKIYQDQTARLEALKAGEFDLMRFFSARDWARQTTGKRFSSGQLRKVEFAHQLPTGFQSTVFNTRRPLLQDIRVRQALSLAMDFEWMQRQLFYGAYSRVQGIFGHTDCQASGLQNTGQPYPPPSDAELALLAPYRAQLPASVFGTGYVAPRTDTAAGLRGNLRQAQALLHEAGWRLGADNILRNAQGQKLALEYLDSGEAGSRTVTPWARNLAKLGVVLTIRPTDFALYQQRLQKFDFDLTTIAYGGSPNPGQEYAEIFGSKAADTPDSGNYAGVKNPAVDALVQRMVAAQSKAELLPACRALDRVVAHSQYLLPQWAATTHRMVYNASRLSLPATMPPYAQGEDWAISTWWAKP
jgi:microcin C transport system substrate-binding protein